MSRRSGFAATLGALFRTQAPSVGSGGARVGDDGRGEEVENDVTAAKHSGKSTSFKARRRFKPKCRTYQTHFNFAPSKENIPVEPIKRPREAQKPKTPSPFPVDSVKSDEAASSRSPRPRGLEDVTNLPKFASPPRPAIPSPCSTKSSCDQDVHTPPRTVTRSRIKITSIFTSARKTRSKLVGSPQRENDHWGRRVDESYQHGGAHTTSFSPSENSRPARSPSTSARLHDRKKARMSPSPSATPATEASPVRKLWSEEGFADSYNSFSTSHSGFQTPKHQAQHMKKEGSNLYKQGQFVKAIEKYTEALELASSPQLAAVILANRAAAWMALGRFAKAARDCETSIEHDPDYAKAYARCCRVYIKLGCINRAREVVHGACERFKDNTLVLPELMSLRGSLNVAMDTLADAKQRIDARGPDAMVDLTASLESIDQVLQCYPGALQALGLKARAWCFQRNGPAAIALCVEHLPQQLGGLSDAIDAEVSLCEEHASLAVDLAHTYWCSRNIPEASDLLGKAIQVFPHSRKAQDLLLKIKQVEEGRTRARALFEKKQYQAALDTYVSLTATLYGNDELLSDVYASMAAVFLKMGKYAHAIKVTTRAVGHCPNHLKCYFRRAKAQVALDRYEEGISDFEIALKIACLSSASDVSSIEQQLAAAKQLLEKAKKPKTPPPPSPPRAAPTSPIRPNEFYGFSPEGRGDGRRCRSQHAAPAKEGPQPQTSAAAAKPTQRPPLNRDTFYTILGVSQEANKAEIKKAYFKLARVYHPDKAKPGDDAAAMAEDFKDIEEAYRTLSSPKRKKEYDSKVRGGWFSRGFNFSSGFYANYSYY